MNKDRLKTEFDQLGINYHELRWQNEQVRKTHIIGSIIHGVHAPLSGIFIYLDFALSHKAEPSKPLIDLMTVTVRRSISSGKAFELMKQAFLREWGPLPSLNNIERRVADCLETNMSVANFPGTAEEKLKFSIGQLGFDYDRMKRHVVDDNTTITTYALPVDIYGNSDVLVFDTKKRRCWY